MFPGRVEYEHVRIRACLQDALAGVNAENLRRLFGHQFHQLAQADGPPVESFIVGDGEHGLLAGQARRRLEDIAPARFLGLDQVTGRIGADHVDGAVLDGLPQRIDVLLLA